MSSHLPSLIERISWLKEQWHLYGEAPCSAEALIAPALRLYEDQVLMERPSEFGVLLTLFLCEVLQQVHRREEVATLVARALAWAELDISRREKVALLSWQCRMHSFFQRQEEALTSLAQLSELTRNENDPLLLAQHRRVLAMSLFAQREYRRSIELYRETIELYRRSGDVCGWIGLFTLIAQLHRRLGERDEMLAAYVDCVAGAVTQRRWVEASNASTGIAEEYAERGEHALAELALKDARDLAGRAGTLPVWMELELCATEAVLCALKEDKAGAVALMRKAIESGKALGWRDMSQRLRQIVPWLLDLGQVEEAVTALERAHGLELEAAHEVGRKHMATQLRLLEVDHAKAEQARSVAHSTELAARNQALERANATLEELGGVGRNIAGILNANAIFSALDTHVHALLDVTAFVIYQLEEDGRTLKMVFGVEGGQAVPPHITRLDSPISKAALCARERREVIADLSQGHEVMVPGTLANLSVMFSPLVVGERLLGVMTIQSSKAKAYAEREVAIFRTLCAYGAIALANAQAQAQLVQAEKMASLGQLVANVAHEINTPIGAVKSSGANIADGLKEALAELPKLGRLLSRDDEQHFIALVSKAYMPSGPFSSREERAARRDLSGQLQAAGLENSERKARLLMQLRAQDGWQEHLPLFRHPDYEIIQSSAERLAAIINNTGNINLAVERVSKMVLALKGFAKAEQADEWEHVDVRQALDTVLTVYQQHVKQGLELVLECEDLGPLHCVREDMSQLWTHLIHNALQAMEYKGRLSIGIHSRRHAGRREAVLSVGDSGHGIPDEIRPRIFDAFFTTRRAGEGSGLGLYLIKKMVDKHQGRIEVQTSEGVGTTIAVHLPLN
ncbi:ATP-binding protein [Roseateles albus]|uniref:histidine kinase n=1 Tax=Roseateles albus TaxID=2987525 RepID=A0ABT5KKI5_9BURK|nr:ATP-binding protein [Roseateles albus]MDC8774459.1 ATP-binding protein [Roseateles albus]